MAGESVIGMDRQSESGSATRTSGAYWIGLFWTGLLAIALLYVLLLGPAVRFYPSCPKPIQKAIICIYAPLDRVEHTHLEGLLSWYIDLWA
jgi:hypothetical protein